MTFSLSKTDVSFVCLSESPHKDTTTGSYYYRFKIGSIDKHTKIKQIELRIFKSLLKKRERVSKFYRTDIKLESRTRTSTRSFMVSSTGVRNCFFCRSTSLLKPS